ncbi:MAG: hypothetical protein ABJZ55_00375 [Fuerstiella sp.]
MSKRFKICLSLWFAVLAVSLCSGQTFAQESLPLAPSSDASVPLQMAPVPATPEGAPTELPTATLVPSAPVAVISDEDWSVQILPALKLKSDVAVSEIQLLDQPQESELHVTPLPTMSREEFASEYQRVYHSIPFNRVEYNRNPTYRHDSAMEILTGNARHQTIVKHQPQQIVRPAAQSRRINPSQFGYLRPALRLNYYRYFPSLNPYLNSYNLSGAF